MNLLQDAPARLFFALWPPEPVARELMLHAKALRVETGGRVTQRDSIHLTLAFLGEVPVSRLPQLTAPVSVPRVAPFAMRIDRLGVWSHNGIGWAGPGTPPEELLQLQVDVAGWLRDESFLTDPRPFRPHITLVRKANGHWPTAYIPPIEWLVDDFVLVRSRAGTEGSRYEVLQRYDLAAMSSEE